MGTETLTYSQEVNSGEEEKSGFFFLIAKLQLCPL